MSENEKAKGPIILVNMFSGSFLEENIAHEIINIFKTDDNQNYVYLPANGNMSNVIIKKAIEKDEEVRILFVHKMDSGKYEVLGRAVVDNSVYRDTSNRIMVNQFYENQSQQNLINQELVYGGKSICSIMEAVGQRFDGEQEKVTFKVKECLRPKSQILINLVNDLRKNTFASGIKKATWAAGNASDLPGQIDISMISRESKKPRVLFRTQREFILPVGYEANGGKTYNREVEAHIQPYAYRQLDSLFGLRDNWEEFPTVEEYRKRPRNLQPEDGRFLALINKDDSELAYSNMLAHFLDENDDICSAFIRFLLGKTDPGHNPSQVELIPLDIAREKKHVDILIDTLDRVFILENKVNACLDEDREQNEDGVREGQLGRYVDAVLDFLGDKAISVFVICPSRNKLYTDYKTYCRTDGREGQLRKVYLDVANRQTVQVLVISYKEILDVLDDFSNVCGGCRENEYFCDFKEMLRWQESEHQTTQSGKLLELSHKRFLRALRISELKE